MVLMNWLCDTNVISEPMRKRPHQGVLHWLEEREICYLSAVTLEEIYCGLFHKEAARQQAWFERFVKHRAEILSVTPSVAMRCGMLRGQFLKKGISRTQADMLIAATALENNLALASRNAKDFEGCGIAVFNPFV